MDKCENCERLERENTRFESECNALELENKRLKKRIFEDNEALQGLLRCTIATTKILQAMEAFELEQEKAELKEGEEWKRQ